MTRSCKGPVCIHFGHITSNTHCQDRHTHFTAPLTYFWQTKHKGGIWLLNLKKIHQTNMCAFTILFLSQTNLLSITGVHPVEVLCFLHRNLLHLNSHIHRATIMWKRVRPIPWNMLDGPLCSQSCHGPSLSPHKHKPPTASQQNQRSVVLAWIQTEVNVQGYSAF